MKFKKRAVLGVLLSTGLYLLDNLRERMPDNIDDIKGKARETYQTASDRLGRATDVLRGKEDSQMLSGSIALPAPLGKIGPVFGFPKRARCASSLMASFEMIGIGALLLRLFGSVVIPFQIERAISSSPSP